MMIAVKDCCRPAKGYKFGKNFLSTSTNNWWIKKVYTAVLSTFLDVNFVNLIKIE